MYKPIITLLSIAILSTTIACNKSSSTTTPSTSTGGNGGGGGGGSNTTSTSFSVKINGTTYTGTPKSCIKQSVSGLVSANMLAEIPYKGGTWTFNVVLSQYTTPKTYYTSGNDTMANLSMTNMANTSEGFSAFNPFAPQEDGICTVTKDDKTYIEGNFSGTLYKGSSTITDSVKVTDGKFVFKWN